MIKKVFTSIEHIWTFRTAHVGASAYTIYIHVCNIVVRCKERKRERERRARKREWMDIKYVIINFPFGNYSSITCSRHNNISNNKKQLQKTHVCNLNFSISPISSLHQFACIPLSYDTIMQQTGFSFYKDIRYVIMKVTKWIKALMVRNRP